jgi:hypothetical protein
MNYFAVTYNVIKGEEIVVTKTVGIKSEKKLLIDTVGPVLTNLLEIEQGTSLVVTDKIDIGEEDYFRLQNRYTDNT